LPEKALLLQPNPYFHTEAIYIKLESAAQRATLESDIQKNFVEFLRMLMYAALDNAANFDHEKALEILKINDFREMIWAAATRRRIHRRSMGSLLQHRKSFIQKTGKRDSFSIPAWVEEMEPDLLDTFRVDSSSPEAGTDQSVET